MNNLTPDQINDQFIDSCRTGNLNEAIRLLTLGANLHAENNSAFLDSCQYNHLEIAKWLHSLDADIHVKYGSVFVDSCADGYFEMAKWLHSLGTDIHAKKEDAFIYSCKGGHFEIAKWLHSLGTNIHSQNEGAFKYSCKNGHFEIAKWLYSLGADIRVLENISPKYSRKNGPLKTMVNFEEHVTVTKWLKDLIYVKQSENIRNSKEIITVNIPPGTNLYRTVNGIRYDISLEQSILCHIPECCVKIGSNKFNLVKEFSNKQIEHFDKKSLKIPAGTMVNQNGMLVRLVNETFFDLGETFNMVLPKGSKLQRDTSQFTLENEIYCEYI